MNKALGVYTSLNIRISVYNIKKNAREFPHIKIYITLDFYLFVILYVYFHSNASKFQKNTKRNGIFEEIHKRNIFLKIYLPLGITSTNLK